MKHTTKFLFTLLLSVVSFGSAHALMPDLEVKNTFHTPNDEGVMIYYIIDDDSTEAQVMMDPNLHYRYTGRVKIPSEVTYEGRTYPVAGIYYDAFACSDVTQVIVPSSVRIIRAQAFRKCYYLEDVQLSEGLDTIDKSAFLLCTALKEIYVPNSVRLVDGSAFRTCENLKTVHLPEKLTQISQLTFRRCYALTDIKIPETVDMVKGSAFMECTGLTEVNIPKNTREVYHWVFRNCSNLASVSLPEGLTLLGLESFLNCNSLKEISLPAGLDFLYANTFTGCTNLQRVDMPRSLPHINRGVFKDCASLQSITLPDDITKIYSEAFSGCRSLATPRIPDGVWQIGDSAFKDCSGMATPLVLPHGLTEISNRSFAGCSSLPAVTIPATLQYGRLEGFAGCDNLREVVSYLNPPVNLSEVFFPIETRVFGTLYAPAGTTADYLRTIGWSFTNIVEGLPTNIQTPDVQQQTPTEEGIYSLDGRRLPYLQHGVNIIRMSDGTTRKVVVK